MTSTRYQVYADKRYHGDHTGLMGACADARTSAFAMPGVGFSVQRDGITHATYRVQGGKLAAWMR